MNPLPSGVIAIGWVSLDPHGESLPEPGSYLLDAQQAHHQTVIVPAAPVWAESLPVAITDPSGLVIVK